MKTLKTSLVLVVAMAAIGLHSIQADQPRMKDALIRLREARAALERAEPNKGGHREKAMELIDRAIAEVETGMAVAR